MKRPLYILVLLPLFLTAGCGWTWWQPSPQALNDPDTTPAMKQQGIVFILPGIQGVDDHYKTIRLGLRNAGVPCAIMIQAWGSQIPGVKLAVNQLGTDADRDWGAKIAQNIRGTSSSTLAGPCT